MKTNIDKQAQNEVKDLLNEYVVSPLDADISVHLKEIQLAIEDLQNDTKKTIRDNASVTAGEIGRLRTKADSFKEDLQEYQEIITGKIEEVREELLKEVSRESHELVDQMNRSFQESTELIKELFKKLNQTVDDYYSGTTDTLRIQEEAANKRYSEIQCQIEALEHTISEGFEIFNSFAIKSGEEIRKDIQGAEEKHLSDTEKKYKTILYLSLSLGIMNLIGIATIIIMNFI